MVEYFYDILPFLLANKGRMALYLKSIELVGFKSFADKTILNFEPGVTGVVGPNGSGKSNISDAIRWVMGEMSAKALRGGNMQDVIFNGTEKRKPLGYAQVSLTLENTGRTFNIDYDEVCVSRRVYRSGESEYYINGAQCRLKDIHELFMDTGLGRDGYSIIGQGKVSEIVSGKNEERRNILDEASGISKYRHRKEEAQRKLGHTEENLVRIGDIVTELEGQVEPLFKQSEKAKKYLNLREELKKIDLNLFIRSTDRLKKDGDAADANFIIVTEQLGKSQSAFSETEAKIEEENAKAEAQEKLVEQLHTESTDTEVVLRGYLGEIDVLKQRIESGKSASDRSAADVQNLKARLAAAQENHASIENERRALEEKLDEKKAELAALEENSRATVLEYEDHARAINDNKSDIIDKLNEIAELKAQLSSLEAFKTGFAERKEALSKTQAASEQTIRELADKKKSAEALLKAQQEKIAELEAECNTLDTQVQIQEGKYAAAELSRIQATEAYNKKASRLHMLREMEKDFEGFARGVKGVLEAHTRGALKSRSIHGALTALMEVEPRAVVAIETVLGAAAQNVVVENEEDAKAAIAYLKENRLGRVTFLPVSSVKGTTLAEENEVRGMRGYVALASALVKTDARYVGIIRHLLGRTVVADNIDNAIAISKKFGYKFRVVTLEGEVLNAGGAITGGSVNKSTGLLSRAGEIKTLERETAALKRETEAAEVQMEEIKKVISDTSTQRAQLAQKLQVAQQECVRLEADAQYAAQDLFASENAVAAAAVEKEQIDLQIKDANDSIAIVINKITSNEFAVEEANRQIAEHEESLAACETARAAAMEAVSQKNIEITSFGRDIFAYKQRAEDVLVQVGELARDIEGREADIRANDDAAIEMLAQIAQKEQLVSDTRKKSEQIYANIDAANAARAEAKAAAAQLLADSKEAREKIFALREEQTRINNQRVKISEEMENLSERIWNDYELTYSTALEYKAEIGTVTEAQKNLASLRGQIRALGNVNVDAIEEYKSVKERFDFLSNQFNDLTTAKKDLEKLIASIQEKMKEQFKVQFAVINKHFSETFTALFGGGRAELKLVDPENVLESGIEIEAQPPGKKLQNLSLLSGGEMAFTAIALLFAILKVRPTPFCVLDEIEAALDESNVYRFADYVRDYSKKTQFILVTHRRGTMEAADLLYGVTMQEKGVSKLLALRLDEAQNLE